MDAEWLAGRGVPAGLRKGSSGGAHLNTNAHPYVPIRAHSRALLGAPDTHPGSTILNTHDLPNHFNWAVFLLTISCTVQQLWRVGEGMGHS